MTDFYHHFLYLGSFSHIQKIHLSFRLEVSPPSGFPCSYFYSFESLSCFVCLFCPYLFYHLLRHLLKPSFLLLHFMFTFVTFTVDSTSYYMTVLFAILIFLSWYFCLILFIIFDYHFSFDLLGFITLLNTTVFLMFLTLFVFHRSSHFVYLTELPSAVLSADQFVFSFLFLHFYFHFQLYFDFHSNSFHHLFQFL